MEKTPVLVTFFNRPEKLKRLLDRLVQEKDIDLFFASDGPRNVIDAKLLTECWELVYYYFKDIPQKNTLTRETNFGCKVAMSENINWFFRSVEAGIILEDDCLPSSSFFNVMRIALDQYKSDMSYISISGTDVYQGTVGTNKRYRETLFPMVWGWATWADRWKLYDVDIRDGKNVTKIASEELFGKKFSLKKYLFRWIFTYRFYEVRKGNIDTWDYSLTATAWRHKMKSLQINGNQILNVGFDKEATHTTQIAPNWVPETFVKHLDIAEIEPYDRSIDQWIANETFHISLSEFIKNCIKWIWRKHVR